MRRGIVTLLVTGRVLEDVQRACEEFSPFDPVVVENGAVVYLSGLGRTIQIGNPPPDRFLGQLTVRAGRPLTGPKSWSMSLIII